jgi:phage gpG-like protein
MEFHVDASDILRDAARMQAAVPMVRQELTQAMQRSVLAVEGRAKGLAPVRTGQLRGSITSEVRPAGGVITGIVGTNVPYARIVHDGRGPVVAHGRALRFTIGGTVFFRKRVGPAKGNPFLRNAFAQSRATIQHEFAQVIPRIRARMGL